MASPSRGTSLPVSTPPPTQKAFPTDVSSEVDMRASPSPASTVVDMNLNQGVIGKSSIRESETESDSESTDTIQPGSSDFKDIVGPQSSGITAEEKTGRPENEGVKGKEKEQYQEHQPPTPAKYNVSAVLGRWSEKEKENDRENRIPTCLEHLDICLQILDEGRKYPFLFSKAIHASPSSTTKHSMEIVDPIYKFEFQEPNSGLPCVAVVPHDFHDELNHASPQEEDDLRGKVFIMSNDDVTRNVIFNAIIMRGELLFAEEKPTPTSKVTKQKPQTNRSGIWWKKRLLQVDIQGIEQVCKFLGVYLGVAVSPNGSDVHNVMRQPQQQSETQHQQQIPEATPVLIPEEWNKADTQTLSDIPPRRSDDARNTVVDERARDTDHAWSRRDGPGYGRKSGGWQQGRGHWGDEQWDRRSRDRWGPSWRGGW
ncbi:hypothetical protein UCRPC4_g00727 [Phaeomoniella chlamydospora]|uniref:Uncharacterized protein n=1 Tax=Phaeomoniella chlamydospora TaxID=158046 RepID=A0A0G2EZH1_PHACM|nr:hypothetical protein UCRPC4_g00727 [Phaeomoniella chlamydospora]